MRLIDVEQTLWEMRFEESKYEYEENYGYRQAEEFIKQQPTVEAIPIEWIKNWCLKNYPTYPRIITEELLKKTETWRMIEEWEKENEID